MSYRARLPASLSLHSGAFGFPLVGCVLLCAHPALAFEPGETRTLPCRPTIACTADLVPPGAFELEAGALFRRIGDQRRQWTYPFLAKLTLAPWIQLQAGSNGYTVNRGERPSRFFDDAQLGGKVHIADEAKYAPSLAVSALLSVPTTESDGYLQTYDALFTFYASKELGPVHADLNMGANAWRIEGAPRPQEWIAAAMSTSLPAPFGVMVETYYFTDAAPVSPRDGGFLFAISHSPKPWLMFDFGGDIGMFPSTRAYSVFVGMSVVPVLLWREERRPSSL
jgi:hypothetical protein